MPKIKQFIKNRKVSSNKVYNKSRVSRFSSGKLNKIKHIERNKRAEDSLRKQIEIENQRNINVEYGSESEEDTFDQLLSTFNENQVLNRSAVDSSESDDDLPENKEAERRVKTRQQVNDIDAESSTDSEASADSDVSDEIDDIDPFCIHLNHNLSPEMLNAVTCKPQKNVQYDMETPNLGCLKISIPSTNNDSSIKIKKIVTPVLVEEQKFARMGTVPKIIDYEHSNLSVHVKIQIEKNIGLANKNNLPQSNKHILTPLQSELFSLMNNYQDIYFPNRNLSNGEEVRFIYCLHALNHVLKTRLKIIRHNSKLNKLGFQNNLCVSDQYRDQGLVRPKVLIVLPFRDSAYRVINTLINLLVRDSCDVINHKKFVDEFSGTSISFPIKNPKPDDFEKTFEGNIDDRFRIGLSLTKKCVKLYTEFSKSDIIISSPLGLRTIIGAPGEKDRNFDFLSSIELLIMDQMEIFMAQNWDHLLHILNHMHLQPQTVTADFSRVRTWSINGLSKFYCQTFLFASHDLPNFRAIYNHRCLNYRGQIRVAKPITNGSIKKVLIQVPQIFHRIDVLSLESSFDDRFNHFKDNVLPQYINPTMAHCLIYIPSYFDYVRIRNYMKRETTNFVQICEYSKEAKIARARDMFFHSSARFLLYSERAHFFKRSRIKGIRHLIFYQPPNWPNFYAEMINLMQESNQNKKDGASNSMTITVLYTKYDMLQISEIVGNANANKMLSSDKMTHMFMTGS